MIRMTRENARQEIRSRWRDIITEYTEPARDNVNGETSYICPICGHGKGGDGLTYNPRSKDGNGLKCFGCNFTGDIIALIREHTGVDYNTALNEAAGILGIEIESGRTSAREDFAPSKENGSEIGPNSHVNTGEHKTPTDGQKTPGQGQNGGGPLLPNGTDPADADFSAYYEQCLDRLTRPEARAYLERRGISMENARRFKIGYDPQADPVNVPGGIRRNQHHFPVPRIIIPVTPGHYIGRSIDPNTEKKYCKMNNIGCKIGIFNADALKPATDQEQARPVFVTEGAFDALSVIEAGADAIALNSTSNVNLLLEKIDQAEAPGPFILCLDKDGAGQRAQRDLVAGLRKRGLPFISADINGAQKDPNEALTANKYRFRADIEKAKREAGEAARLPGLLSYAEAVNVFETATDKRLDMKSFPKFSETANIQLHDSVVLAADTGAGKSSLAINFVNDLNSQYPVIYFNLEMTMIQVLRRLTAIYSGFEIKSIEQYRKDPKIAEAVNISLKAITSRKPLQVLQATDAATVEQMTAIIDRSIKGREEPTIVIIDHSLLVNTEAGTSARYERFTQISESLRRLSLSRNIILFILLQQNRAGKASEEERPRNSSLKESGSWENDATHICFLWYDPLEPGRNKKKILLTKNRNGESGGEFPLDYNKYTQTYREAEPAAGTEQGDTAADSDRPQKLSRRERQRQKLINAYNDAYILTFGEPTLKDIAEAADVTTGTVKSWIKEYGGCTIDGVQLDPAGIDTKVELTGFIKLTRADNAPEEITEGEEDSEQDEPGPDQEESKTTRKGRKPRKGRNSI